MAPPEANRDLPRPLTHRIAAGLALVALLVAGGVSAWWILTDQVDLRRLGRPAPEAQSEAGGSP